MIEIVRPITPASNPLQGASFSPELRIPEPVRDLEKELRELCVDTGANGMQFLYGDAVIGKIEPETKDRRTPTASCTKSLAAITIFKLAEMGRLDIDQPLSKIIKNRKIFSLDHYTQITPRHLLTHTSGLPGNAYFMPEDKSRWIPGDAQFLNHLAPLFDVTTRAAMHPLVHKIGEVFDYSNPGTQILEAVASAALRSSGDTRDVSLFIHEEVLEPMGMSETSLWKENGVTMLYGGMTSTAEDLTKLGKIILNNGMVDGRSVLSPESSCEMVATPTSIPKANKGYGHLWWRRNDLPAFEANGYPMNLVLIVPDYNIIMTQTRHVPVGPDLQQAARAEADRFMVGYLKSLKKFVLAVHPTDKHPL